MLHHDVHPPFVLKDLFYRHNIGVGELTHNLDFVAQEFFLLLIQLGLVNSFQRVSRAANSALGLKNLRKFTCSQFYCLVVILSYIVESAVLPQFDKPCINSAFLLMEQHPASECRTVVMQAESPHVVLVFDLVEIQAL